MPNKNVFSILNSPSVSLSSNASISKSRGKSKSRDKSNRKNKSRSKSKGKSNGKSVSKNKSKSKNKITMKSSKTFKSPNKVRTLSDITNTTRNTNRMYNNRNTTLKTKYSPKLAWRKNSSNQSLLKPTRNKISEVLNANNWSNKIEPNDIINIKYNTIKEMHIHLYKIGLNSIGYHVKVTFPLNKWSVLLQYNHKTDTYDFVVKNENQTVLMREDSKNTTQTVENLTNFKQLSLNQIEASKLINNMKRIIKHVENTVKPSLSGGKKRVVKTHKKKKQSKQKTRKNKGYNKLKKPCITI